ncbi:hypothetical protein SEA_MAKAI_78 [Arthrobacter phage Makai]|nr:hypothetical protein SEA_MAKAI_78 [Arthrobacter phage Makai]QPX62540.1 hypothetical protein SEA_TRUCKEE_76 [Arthrobacter phage Truckee]
MYTRTEEQTMAKTMCERVELSPLVGSYILAMCRLKSTRPGNQVDMTLVAWLIKYASDHRAELRPQFRFGTRYVKPTTQSDKPANFTFLK